MGSRWEPTALQLSHLDCRAVLILIVAQYATKPVQRRRRHSPAFKARIIAACQQPGASVARVALEHGLNDNMVRRWIKTAQGKPVAGQGDFVPLALPAPRSGASHTLAEDVIRIEVPRPSGSMTVTWPAKHADQVLTLLRDVLL